MLSPDALAKPLSQTELKHLADFLRSPVVPEGCLTLEGLDGFICAISVGPDLMRPSEWLTWVWGHQDGPEFASEEEAQAIIGSILRHWNTIQRTVRRNPVTDKDTFAPIIEPSAADVPDDATDSALGAAWAKGFMRGMAPFKKQWDTVLDVEEVHKSFIPILLLNHGTQQDLVHEVLTHAKRRQVIDMLPKAVHSLWAFWRHKERKSAANHPVNPSNSKVGRNDPCPCGSGKKFKKCCLH